MRGERQGEREKERGEISGEEKRRFSAQLASVARRRQCLWSWRLWIRRRFKYLPDGINEKVLIRKVGQAGMKRAKLARFRKLARRWRRCYTELENLREAARDKGSADAHWSKNN